MRLPILLVLLLAASAAAEINAPPGAPPQAMPLSVTVRRGASVEITLRAYGRANQQLRFKLRSRPALGSLSDPKSLNLETAVVTYQHDGKAAPLLDHFTFAVQSNAGVSVPAEVEIKIVDDAPLLIAPEAVDFKTAAPGGTAEHEITIENRGGGIATGTLIPPENWTVRGDAKYVLDRKEGAKFTLVFAPKEEREYRGDLRYSSNSELITSLHGLGSFPMHVSPATLILHASKDGTTRSGAAELENRTDAAEAVETSADARLHVSSKINVPPREKVSLPIEITDDVSAFNGKLSFVCGTFSASIDVQAAAAGPILQAAPAEVIFPKAAADEVVHATADVQNIGGTRAFVQAAVSQPFEIAKDDAAFSLDPGQKRAVHLTSKIPESGTLRAALTFNSGDAHAEVQVRAEGAAAQARPSYQAGVVAVADAEEQSPPETFSAVAPVRKFSVDAITTGSATLRWTAPADAPLKYVVEMQRLSFDQNDELKVDWLTMQGINFKRDGKQVSAVLTGLRPGEHYLLRIASVDAQGLHSTPSQLIPLTTLAQKPLRWGILLWASTVFLIAYTVMRRIFPYSPPPNFYSKRTGV